MQTIAKLIELALIECADQGVIDWLPGDAEAPETFWAECEIESNQHAWSVDYYLSICGIFCIIDVQAGTCWHASKIPSY